MTSYPYLQIARDFYLQYRIVLTLEQWFGEGCRHPAVWKARSTDRHNVECFLMMPDHFQERVLERISMARRIFLDQKAGMRDLDGNPIANVVQFAR